jgi:hypothetical protein
LVELDRGNKHDRIKVAILDTGVDENDETIIAAQEYDSIKPENCKGFPEEFNPMRDTVGHGTHAASVLFKTAPLASIYIARITDETGLIPSDDNYKSTVEVSTP